jgi:hypothetical protein
VLPALGAILQSVKIDGSKEGGGGRGGDHSAGTIWTGLSAFSQSGDEELGEVEVT